jgi:branched-chain amino acid transport system substrate-binding protein
MKKIKMIGLTAAVLACASAGVFAQTSKVSSGAVRIGVLNDQSGVYSDMGGTGSVLAARMAVEDFGGTVLGVPIEILSSDHQNKADIGAARAREWFDINKVDMITDLAASNVGLAVMKIAKEKNRIVLNTGSGSSRITNEDCNDRTVHWVYNTYALANGTGKTIIKQGGDSWYFLTADYAFGHSLEKDTTEVIKAAGGKIAGGVRHPLNTSDFSSYLMQAQTSKAKIIGLANAGTDTINSIKAARDFGVTKNQTLAGLLAFISDVHSLGVNTAQGMLLTEAFYWDMNDETRAWSRRFFEKQKRMPSMIQAGTYSAITHYLKAIKAAGTTEPGAVMAKMKAAPVKDFFTKHGVIRDDGQLVHDMFLFQVKTPAESKRAWDYYKLVATIPGDQAFAPLSASLCPLVKKL